ncbi:GNAT family N-acetyltransferase [Actinophytocola sp. NPDC049390]|uniref:GNAT family N-acetyltransferase n=1 Tax=Actinophytocola sp. NPDC049390 TaxID=3363894 RepID=UPI003797C0A2
MRFRADWLREVLTVPYVPILGPVHPDLADAILFDEVLTAALEGVVLPYDKHSRWHRQRPEVPLVDEIVHQPKHTIIPVLSRRGAGTIKLFFYGAHSDLPELQKIVRVSCRVHKAAHGQVVVFDQQPAVREGRVTRLLLKEFQAPSPRPGASPISELRPDQLTEFLVLADRLAEHGFGFLGQRLADGRVTGPVLVAWDEDQMVGAIGPLDTLRDRQGTRMLLPQYFGVLPEHHGHGHGRALWRAAADWGHRHGAAYQLLQTQLGQASDQLFLSEGLHTLGFATTVHA